MEESCFNNKTTSENIFLKGAFPFLWIAILCFAVYTQILFFDYTYLDDNALILENFHFISNLKNIVPAFKGDVFHQAQGGTYYRPILTLSFMLDAQLGGKSPFMYHLTDILLHIIATCFIFLLFVKLNYKRPLSLFFSLIFAAHPILVQAIAWIPGRNDSLLSVFILPSFLFFINFIRTKKIQVVYSAPLILYPGIIYQRTRSAFTYCVHLIPLFLAKGKNIFKKHKNIFNR